jgi:hypothetical protein
MVAPRIIQAQATRIFEEIDRNFAQLPVEEVYACVSDLGSLVLYSDLAYPDNVKWVNLIIRKLVEDVFFKGSTHHRDAVVASFRRISSGPVDVLSVVTEATWSAIATCILHLLECKIITVKLSTMALICQIPAVVQRKQDVLIRVFTSLPSVNDVERTLAMGVLIASFEYFTPFLADEAFRQVYICMCVYWRSDVRI